MSDLRVRVQRPSASSTCPFCKDEVTSGHVWVCPDCQAPHHAACHAEHGKCASCRVTVARAPVRVDLIEVVAPTPAPRAPSRLRTFRLALWTAGFAMTHEDPLELRARSPSCAAFGGRPCEVVVVDGPARVTRAFLGADPHLSSPEPTYPEETLLLHLTDAVDEDARGGLGLMASAGPTRARLAWTPAAGLVAPPAPDARLAPHLELARRLAEWVALHDVRATEELPTDGVRLAVAVLIGIMVAMFLVLAMLSP